MEIRLLGTGTSQGIPVIGCDCEICKSGNPKDKRLRASILLRWDDFNYVIDCGPDFRTQMLRENIKHIDGILFTHEHSDHTAGLDDIRPLYFRMGKAFPVYALSRVIRDLEKRFDYIFAKENRYPGAPEIETNILIENQMFTLGNREFTPLVVMHGKLPVIGFKTGDFAYITDAKTIPEKTFEQLLHINTIVINSLHHQPHKMHMNLEETLAFIEKIKPKNAVLTHISHHMGKYDEIQAGLPENIVLGYDGMSIFINP